MQETILHSLWENKLLPGLLLQTDLSQSIRIIDPGKRNPDSGPDFFNGKIEIEGVVHVGNIEMHVNSSDWYLHGHQTDPAYENVILHVVYNHDKEVMINNVSVPTIELNRYLEKHYFSTVGTRNAIPCSGFLSEIPGFYLQNQVKHALLKRIDRKTNLILRQYKGKGPQELVLILFAGAFGMKTNALPFVELAQRLPFRQMMRCDLESLEAIVFGVSGLTRDDEHPYVRKLNQLWDFHKRKMNLGSQNPVSWKFKGCRPSGFPTIRLAQFASFLFRMDWSQQFWEQPVFAILQYLRKILCQSTPEYWQNHHDFGKISNRVKTAMSRDTADTIIVNAAIPFMCILSIHTGQKVYCEKALELLELMPPEKNATMEFWRSHLIEAKNSGDSQGLLELKNEFCGRKRCLDCSVGQFILGKEPNLDEGFGGKAHER